MSSGNWSAYSNGLLVRKPEFINSLLVPRDETPLQDGIIPSIQTFFSRLDTAICHSTFRHSKIPSNTNMVVGPAKVELVLNLFINHFEKSGRNPGGYC
jgi:hypothetical protein